MAQHKELAAGRWHSLTFFEQMAHIGSEIERTIKWIKKGNSEYSTLAFIRALELIDLTITDKKNKTRLKELTRAREILADHFFFNNSYNTTDQQWSNYFLSFTFAARINK
jgi:hypothetical protein